MLVPKMRNMFELPVQVVKGRDSETVELSGDGLHYAVMYSKEQANAAAHTINCHDDLVEALTNAHRLIVEGTKVGFNPHDGDWADRLFNSQCQTFRTLKKAKGED